MCHEQQIHHFSNLLQTCAKTSNLSLGAAIHAHLLKLPILSSSLFLLNHLLLFYSKTSPSPSPILRLLDEIPHPNAVSFSLTISGLVHRFRDPLAALSLFSSMHLCTRPNHFTLLSALHAASLLDRQPLISHHLFAQVLKLGYQSNVFLTNAFLTCLFRACRLHEATKLFESCQFRDTVSWNSMMAGLLELDESCDRVWELWRRMLREGVQRDEFSFSTLFAACSSCASCGIQAHAQLVRSGLGCDTFVGNSLMDMYFKLRDLVSGTKVFDEMHSSRNVVSWTQMAAGSLHCGQPSKALEVVARMKSLGVRPNEFTLATAFHACSSLASLGEGTKAHGFRVKLGDKVDEFVDNALVDMYAKCGTIDDAVKAFRRIRSKNCVSWTTLIKGFAENGLPHRALQVFDEMILDGVWPNHVTFVCVLCACSQGGLVDKGRKLFMSMRDRFGISPMRDHYICMVNLLGKAGHLADAEAMILSMPFRAGAELWQTLLGSCRIHGDVETGRRAAERVLEMEKGDPSTYLLLSNMFADMSIWDGVRRVREMMVGREMKRVAGSSWIDSS